jgi:hypothetical protein
MDYFPNYKEIFEELKINLRDNYSTSEDVKDITFDFVIYMMTNSFPDVVPDEALWNRFLFFPFDAKFTLNDSEVNESNHIYKEDPDLFSREYNSERVGRKIFQLKNTDKMLYYVSKNVYFIILIEI